MTGRSPSPVAVARRLSASYHLYKLGALTPAKCRHSALTRTLKSLVAHGDGPLATKTVGHSLEGREINLLICGTGRTHILLWSQMHGDEPTATLALLDVCAFLARRAAVEEWVAHMLQEVTLLLLPMLNPDGAERGRRETAVSIDLNRDARVLMTPEARILKAIHDQYTPAFGFNLHDQELSSVGISREITAMALLAPPADGHGSMPPGRMRAVRVAALIAEVLERLAGGRIARYDDSFESRAFGDTMQRRGTSTILIESGHWPGDEEKVFIRKLNYVSLLTSCYGISTGWYKKVMPVYYHRLPVNGKSVYDIVVRNVRLVHPGGWDRRVDVGLLAEPRLNRTGGRRVVTLKGVGDLRTCARLETVSAGNHRVPHRHIAIGAARPLVEMLRLLGAR